MIGIAVTLQVSRSRHQKPDNHVTRPAGNAVPDGHGLLFVVRADGRLVPVTEHGRPAPETGDTLSYSVRHGRPAARVTSTGTVTTLDREDG